MTRLPPGISRWRKRVRRRWRVWRDDPVARLLALSPKEDAVECYARIRAKGDLVGDQKRGLLIATSYESCSAVLKSDDFGVAPTGLHRRQVLPLPPYRGLMAHPVDDSLFGMDPPRHTVVRRLVVPWFASRAGQQLEPALREIVTGSLDRLTSLDTPLDLVSEFAARIPAEAIGAILGLPRTDTVHLIRWGGEFVSLLDGARTVDEEHRLRRVLSEMGQYFTEVLDHRRRELGTDLLSHLVGSDELTPRELLATTEALCIAGFETTTDLICGAVVALDRHPDQRALFSKETHLCAGLIEETLRYNTPVHYVVRTAGRPCQVSGHAIRAGTSIIVLLASANRDPNIFDDPDRFDIKRDNARAHLAFSAGAHYCLGASLARTEARIALPLLYERFPNLALASPPVQRDSRVLRGPAKVLIRQG